MLKNLIHSEQLYILRIYQTRNFIKNSIFNFSLLYYLEHEASYISPSIDESSQKNTKNRGVECKKGLKVFMVYRSYNMRIMIKGYI